MRETFWSPPYTAHEQEDGRVIVTEGRRFYGYFPDMARARRRIDELHACDEDGAKAQIEERGK